MNSHFSILKFVNNALSDENISLGLVMISKEDVYFKISNQKLEIAKKLNPQSIKLLDFSLKQLRSFVAQELSDQSYKLIRFKNTLDNNFISRLSAYNNGILQFSQPSFIKSELDDNTFYNYFQKFIGEKIEPAEVIKTVSQLKINIENKLYDPLKDKIDVDYTLKKRSLPSLFFDFHFDGIGVNGAMYAAKSIDLNSGKPISSIRSEISEYESVIERLNVFAKEKGINGVHQYNLIVDPYLGNTLSYNDLYSILKEGNMPLFKIISSDNLDSLVKEINKTEARKFSEELIEI